MIEFRNAKGRRIFDISEDKKTIKLVSKGCVTYITVNEDGTLNVENQLLVA